MSVVFVICWHFDKWPTWESKTQNAALKAPSAHYAYVMVCTHSSTLTVCVWESVYVCESGVLPLLLSFFMPLLLIFSWLAWNCFMSKYSYPMPVPVGLFGIMSFSKQIKSAFIYSEWVCVHACVSVPVFVFVCCRMAGYFSASICKYIDQNSCPTRPRKCIISIYFPVAMFKPFRFYLYWSTAELSNLHRIK